MLAPLTMNALLDLTAIPAEAIPLGARAMARLSLFDWLTVGLAGVDQPVARVIRDFVADEGGKPSATVIGLAQRVPARAAALANGAISHALDYDDTHFGHVGHPAVAILPAALAVAEVMDVSSPVLIDAFLIGAEASIRIGMVLGRPHYNRGFHQTATAGAFGATIAASRVMGLTRAITRQALSLVATRASGLKSQFGSMGKPYNAGIAAANGVEAAALARRGFISCDDGVGGAQGFVDSHVDEAFEAAAWAAPPPGTFLFEDIKHKLHACCHGLHATIEALKVAKGQNTIEPARVTAVHIRVNPRWLRVCNIELPRTGLEAKFSYSMITAMTLNDIDTAAEATYSDALCRDPRLMRFWPLVEVTGEDALSDTKALVAIEQFDGSVVEVAHDIAERVPTTIGDSPLRMRRHCSLRSSGVSAECISATFWPKALSSKPTICGVSPISGTSRMDERPRSIACCMAAR